MAVVALPAPPATRSLPGRLVDRFTLWVTTWGFNLILTLVGSIGFRTRMSHNNGIAGSGSLTIVDNPSFPLHPFFAAGKVFPCRIRHAAASFRDDAMRAVRSMAIKFSDERFKSPFDLELNTGEVAVFWSVACFMQFAKFKRTAHGIQYPEYYKRYPVGERGALAGLRRNPTLFTNQHFFSQTPYRYDVGDGVTRYAKYRVIPHDDVPESGVLDTQELKIPASDQRILPGETRSRNYLKEEYARRVAQGPVSYRLQIQLHTATPHDDHEIFNSCRAWDEADHPWMDLAHIRIDKTLDWTESTMMVFSSQQMPDGLGVLPAYSIHDYNSLNYMRVRSDIARHARVWTIRMLGMPKGIPSDEDRNV
jgi:catalase